MMRTAKSARRARLPAPGDRLKLGATGLRVSPLCIGIVEDPRTVSAAFDLGVNAFFVTADMHWPLYEGTRRGLADLLRRRGVSRDDIVVFAVSYATQPEFCWAPFSEALEAVPGLGRIDVTVAGGAYASELLVRLPQYRAHRESGFVGARATGVSFHDRAAARQALERGLVDVGFARYNAGHTGARRDLFPFLRAAAKAKPHRPLLYNFKSTGGFVAHERFAALGLGREIWRPSVTDHHRFALTRAEVDGILCAPQTPREVKGIAAALEDGPLSAEEEAFLENLAGLADGRKALVPG